MDNYHRLAGEPISNLAPGNYFSLPWDPFLYGPLGKVLRFENAAGRRPARVITTLGPFGPGFHVIKVEESK